MMRKLKWYFALLLAAFITPAPNTLAPAQTQPPTSQRNDEETPVSYALVVDNSASLRSQLPTVISAGKIIVNRKRPTDETALVRFVDHNRIRTLQDFTQDKAAVNDALDSMYVELGGTAILDAVDYAAQHLARRHPGEGTKHHSALILLTDGDERDSFYKLKTLLQRLRRSKVPIYVIGFTEGLESQGKATKLRSMRLLETLARESGGHAYYPESLSDVERIADAISKELHEP